MTTEEITKRLAELKAIHPAAADGLFPAKEIAAGCEALDAAIHAVNALEQIRQELSGDCFTCAYRGQTLDQPPCPDCWNDRKSGWTFRWDAPAKTTKEEPNA